MKFFFTTLVCLCLSVPIYGQEYPEPEFTNKVYCGKSSNATYSIGGGRTATCVMDPCTVTFTETAFSKSGIVSSTQQLGSNKPNLYATFNRSADRKTITINVLVESASTTGTFSEDIKCSDGGTKVDQSISYPMALAVPTSEIGDVLKLEIADNYNIRPSSFFRSVPRFYTPCYEAGKYDLLVQWEVIQPNFPPTDMTPARKRTTNGE